VEAVIDIGTNAVGLEDLEALSIPEITEKFKTKEQIHTFQAQFEAPLARFSQAIAGYMYRSDDQKEVIQTRMDGFAYNLLQPYTHWDAFLDAAMHYWSIFKRARPSAEAKKLGLRYINVLTFPAEMLEHAFDVGLAFPPNADFGEIQALQYQYVTAMGDNISATVNLARQQDVESSPSYILDIDVTRPMSDSDVSDDLLRSHLTALRNAKNKLFFGTVSANLLDRYK